MTNQITDVANFVETELSSAFLSTDLTANVLSTGGVSAPVWIVIDPENNAKREVIFFDGTITATAFSMTVIGNRGQSGSAAGAQDHASGTLVRLAPVAQQVDDLNDRITGHAHGGGTDGAQVDHEDLANAGTSRHREVGEIVVLAGSTIPAGALECNGQEVSRTTWADLYAAIGDTWGAGDGSTTFNVPDLRDRVLLGRSATKALGDTGGAETHALTTAEMPTHDHTVGATTPTGVSTPTTGHTHDQGDLHALITLESNYLKLQRINVATYNRNYRTSSTLSQSQVNANETTATDVRGDTGGPSATSSHTHGSHTHSVSSTGSGDAHTNMQPWAAGLAVIFG